jgi:SRSO17 transposase
MPAISEVPTLVQHGVEQFGSVFAHVPERRHFAEYLTGLLVAEKKTVAGINAEFAPTTDQSGLTRWITEVDWEATTLNAQRLAWLPQTPQTR